MPSSPNSTLALIVVTHESAKWIPGFIQSWNRTVADADAEGGIDLFAVDCGSGDDSVALMQSLWPSAHVVRCENVGYGAAVNRAAAMTGAIWLLVSNPDVTFSSQFLATFLERQRACSGNVQQKQAGCIAPALLNSDGSTQPSVGRFPTVRSLICDQFRPRPFRKYQRPHPTSTGPVDWASGACLLVRRDAFERAGGFDERYFLYMEEVDLQRRMRDAGFLTEFAPDLVVTHHNPYAGRPARSEIRRYSARGLLRYFARHAPFSLMGYRLLALISGRLSLSEVLSSRRAILRRATGP